MADKPVKGFRIRQEVSDRFSKACRERDYRASHVVEALMITWLHQYRGCNNRPFFSSGVVESLHSSRSEVLKKTLY